MACKCDKKLSENDLRIIKGLMDQFESELEICDSIWDEATAAYKRKFHIERLDFLKKLIGKYS